MRFEKYEKDLKPCPFCGYDKPVIVQHPDGGFYVHCPRWACPQVFAIVCPTIEQAVNAWNEIKRDI